MDIYELQKRANEIRDLYDTHNLKERGIIWTRLQLAQGFVGDVGDLQKIVMAKEGLREMDDVDAKLKHELADCLWSVLVLAENYNVDIETAFLQTMNGLEKRLVSD